jgi:hypothetical protein
VEYFQKLGSLFLSRWKERDFDIDAMSPVAVAVLDELPPSDNVSVDELVDWFLHAPTLPPQLDATSRFGDPAHTVFAHERFFIDVLFWVDGTTAIHEHSFSGAFHVLAGSSIHASYRFEEERRYSEALATGKLALESIERLTRGETRPILSGRRMIHALFHLERPSVSVVLRTHHDAGAGYQFAYDRAGFGSASFFEPVRLIKQRQTLTLVSKIAPNDFQDRARAAIRNADSFTAVRLMEHVAELLNSYGRAKELFESILPAHEDLVRRFIVRCEDRIREANIVRRRALIKAPEHRFFLAVLLNAPTRTSAFEVIARAYPERRPVDCVVQWIEELAKIPSETGEANPMGIAIDETALDVLRLLLEGATDAEVLVRLCETYDDATVLAQKDDVLRMCAAFKKAPFFRPLFA